MRDIYFPLNNDSGDEHHSTYSNPNNSEHSGDENVGVDSIRIPYGLISPQKQNENYKEMLLLFKLSDLSNEQIFAKLAPQF
jgi:hypothetical protein